MQDDQVALVGLGTVGTGVARLLVEHGDRIARHAGRRCGLEQVVVKDLARSATIELPPGLISDDLKRITGDPEITAVALLVGGLEPARTIMLELLESGKDVVTANKALLAEHGPELFDRARELGRSIAFEASVAGGIPIIANISQCLSANQIQSLHAHPQRHEQLHPHADGRARHLVRRRRAPRPSGWAMPRPIRRWTSTAATRRRSWRSWPTWRSAPGSHWSDIPRAGHRHARRGRPAVRQGAGLPDQAAGRGATDGRRAGTARLADAGQAAARRWPKCAGRSTPSASWATPWAACSSHGLGAGQMPTASAVVADLIDTVVGRTAITFRTLELWSKQRRPRRGQRLRQASRAATTCGSTWTISPACWPKSPDVLGKHEHFDRLGHSARGRGRQPGRCAAGDHDAQYDRRGHAPRHRGDRPAAIRARPTACGCGSAISWRRRPASPTADGSTFHDEIRNDHSRRLCRRAAGVARRQDAARGGPHAGTWTRSRRRASSAGPITCRPRCPPGSDVANLSLLGYDPLEYFTGRAPLEAAAQGIELGPNDWAIRCNLVTVEDQTMRDFTADHISTEEATAAVGHAAERTGRRAIWSSCRASAIAIC